MSEGDTIHVEVSDLGKTPAGRTDWARLRSLSEEEARRAAESDPDAQPMSDAELARMQPVPEVRAMREGMGMTQEEFAQAFQLSLGTVRDWEQRRRLPLGPSLNNLRVIAANPKAVIDALNRVA